MNGFARAFWLICCARSRDPSAEATPPQSVSVATPAVMLDELDARRALPLLPAMVAVSAAADPSTFSLAPLDSLVLICW